MKQWTVITWYITSFMFLKLISIFSDQRKPWISWAFISVSVCVSVSVCFCVRCVCVRAVLKPTCHIRWSCRGVQVYPVLIYCCWHIDCAHTHTHTHTHTQPQTLAKHLGKFIHTTSLAWSSHPCLLASLRESLRVSLACICSVLFTTKAHADTRPNTSAYM